LLFGHKNTTTKKTKYDFHFLKDKKTEKNRNAPTKITQEQPLFIHATFSIYMSYP